MLDLIIPIANVKNHLVRKIETIIRSRRKEKVERKMLSYTLRKYYHHLWPSFRALARAPAPQEHSLLQHECIYRVSRSNSSPLLPLLGLLAVQEMGYVEQRAIFFLPLYLSFFSSRLQHREFPHIPLHHLELQSCSLGSWLRFIFTHFLHSFFSHQN